MKNLKKNSEAISDKRQNKIFITKAPSLLRIACFTDNTIVHQELLRFNRSQHVQGVIGRETNVIV